MAVTDYQSILMGKPGALSYDTQTDQSALQRKRRIVQMLMQQALGGTNMIDAGQVKVANWGEALAKVFQAAMAGKMDAELSGEEQKVARANQERKDVATQDFMGNLTGVSPQGPMPDGGAMEQVKPDMVAAIRSAMQSGVPELEKLAPDLLKEHQKQQAPHWATADGVVSASRLGPDGSMSTQRQPVTQFTQSPDMPLVNRNTATNEVRGTTFGNITPPQPAKQFNEALQKEDVKLMSEGRGKAAVAVDTLQMIADAETQLNAMKPEDFGKLAPLKMWMNQLGSSFGGSPFPEGVGLEKMTSLLGERLLERLRLFAPVSNSDAQRMEAIAGATSNTQEAIRAMLDYAAQLAQKHTMSHNEFVGRLEAQPGYGNLDRYKMPYRVTGAAPVVPPSVEKDMEKYGRRKK